MANRVLPRVQAMVLCDEIEESDHESEVVHLTGVRAAIESPVFPLVVSQMCVFMHMSGHRGEANCHIEIEAIAKDEVIHESEPLTFSFVNPTVVEPVHFRLSNCVFPGPGVYYVQTYCGSKLICERPLMVRIEG